MQQLMYAIPFCELDLVDFKLKWQVDNMVEATEVLGIDQALLEAQHNKRHRALENTAKRDKAKAAKEAAKIVKVTEG
jgi:3-dehydroquinate dehydratase